MEQQLSWDGAWLGSRGVELSAEMQAGEEGKRQVAGLVPLQVATSPHMRSIFFKLCCFRVVVVFRRVPLIASSKFNSGRNVDGSGWPREAVQHQRRRHAG